LITGIAAVWVVTGTIVWWAFWLPWRDGQTP
jgi:hypothetical protein